MKQSDTLAFDWVRSCVLQGRLPVAVYGVSTATGVREISAFGTDDSRIASIDDQFAVFSITKPLVAMTAMRLVEQARLSLESDLGIVTDGSASGITLERLLSHRGGLADIRLDRPGQHGLLLDPVTVFPAGTMVQYTNLAFVGVEALVDRGADHDLETELEWLNGIDGVASIGFEPSSAPRRVHGLRSDGFDYPRFRQLHHPAAGLFADAGDLLALGSALLRDLQSPSPRLMRESTLGNMISSRTDGLPRFNAIAGDAREWGLGFGLRESTVGKTRFQGFGHGGWSGCQWWIYPELDRCWVLMTNRIDAALRGVLFEELHSVAIADASGWTPGATPGHDRRLDDIGT